MNRSTKRVLCVLFFLSGFSSLVYQVVWTRLAFASFGIIAPVLSVVLAVFMLGLAVGSWAGGRIISTFVRKTRLSAIYFYGAAELLIGLGAFAVPAMFTFSERMLAGTGQVNSFNYLFFSALALALSIFPWCLCMGTTFPFMMAFVRERDSPGTGSFSFLYAANVAGAMAGTALTALVLVEMFGFHRTLWVAAGGNFLIAAVSAGLGVRCHLPLISAPAPAIALPAPVAWRRSSNLRIKTILFCTGFISMAMEVVWARGFVGVLKTQVYSFALIVFAYLAATYAGSVMYRRDFQRRRARSQGWIFFWMVIAALLPCFVNDPAWTTQNFLSTKIDPFSAVILLASICPLCGLLGYLTPGLIDRYSAGDPQRAGSAYAVNVIGCILGPLCACYVLLPHIGERHALILLGLPLGLFWFFAAYAQPPRQRLALAALICVALAYVLLRSEDLEENILRSGQHAEVRRDYIASVVAYGNDRRGKGLLVNGFGMTTLTPITKFISHLPLSLHRGPVKSVLVICFGMGTSYRSALSWGVDTTAVELVPTVPELFGFYSTDAQRVASNPRGRIIIDDGRRYLARCGKKFDVIVVDPPPPVEAAGSSLLFSTDFYHLAKEHLNPGGIVQVWYPGSSKSTDQAVARSMYESFPYVRFFPSIDGWGMHMLGSMQRIEIPDLDTLVSRFPAAASTDLMEWSSKISERDYLAAVVQHEYASQRVLDSDPGKRVTDDRPFNEYYLIRQFRKQGD